VYEPSIRRSTITSAPPERAFDAWTEPEHLSRWFCDKVTGWPGSGSKLQMTWERFGFSVEYSLPEVRPPRKVVLKAAVPGMGTQTLTISIRPYGAGSQVEVVETGPGAEGQEGAGDAESGWEMSLSILKLYVENYWGQDRTGFFALLAAHYHNEQLMTLYQQSEGLARWLTREGSIGKVGDPVRLVLWEGDVLTGQVLAVTSHELAVSWDEIGGYLELKSFEVNPERKAICVRGSGYGEKLTRDRAEELEKKMEASLIRLFAALTGQPIPE
jgi:uncharacterized protein YndB with AHSA1/START domain